MKKSMVVTTIAMILVVVVAITTATFAWFSVSTSANVTGSFTAGSGSTTIVLFDPTRNNISYSGTPTANADLYTQFAQRSNWSSLLDLGTTSAMQPLVPIAASSNAAAESKNTGLDGTLTTADFAFPTNAFSGTNATAGVYPEFAYAITKNNQGVNGSSTDPSLNIMKQAAAEWTTETADTTPGDGEALQQSLFLATFYLANFSGTPQPAAPLTITISAPTTTNNDKVLEAARFMMVTAPVNKTGDASSSFIHRADTNYGISYDRDLVVGGGATGNALIADNYATALLTKGGKEATATGELVGGLTADADTVSNQGNTTYTFTAQINLPNADLTQDNTGVVAVSLAVWLDGWVLNNDGDAGTFNFSLTVAQAADIV